MEYRRFGKTEKNISVITLGGMRFVHGWDEPREDLPQDSIDNCFKITTRALELGINHIETAYGYMKSEGLYGMVLPQIGRKRDEYFLMTKGNAESGDEFKRIIESQLVTLKTDYFDFYAYHGINRREDFELFRDEMMEILLDYKAQGIFRHVGFSSHGDPDLIRDTMNLDCFDFANLHYYYFNQQNKELISLAGKKDLGILIISPNEKGGRLWDASVKVKTACAPLTPIQFNGRFCLSHPQITTLTMGFHELDHFSDPMGILNDGIYDKDPGFLKAKKLLDSFQGSDGSTFCTLCGKCLPCPVEINIPEVLRMHNMNRYYDMIGFCQFRYNMFVKGDRWFQGEFGNACNDCGQCLPRCPEGLNIPDLVREAHQLFRIEKQEG